MEDWHAICLRENRARNRRARGSDSEVRVLRRARIVGSSTGGGDVADGAMTPVLSFGVRQFGGGKIAISWRGEMKTGKSLRHREGLFLEFSGQGLAVKQLAELAPFEFKL